MIPKGKEWLQQGEMEKEKQSRYRQWSEAGSGDGGLQGRARLRPEIWRSSR